MPIYRDTTGTLIIEFGSGDVLVTGCSATGDPDDRDGVVFEEGVAGVVGRVGDHGGGGLTTGVPLRFHFLRAESVQVVIDNLTKIKANLEARR